MSLQAFMTVVRSYGALLVQFAYLFTEDQHEAEHIVQEALLEYWMSGAQRREQASLRLALLRVVRQAALAHPACRATFMPLTEREHTAIRLRYTYKLSFSDAASVLQVSAADTQAMVAHGVATLLMQNHRPRTSATPAPTWSYASA